MKKFFLFLVIVLALFFLSATYYYIFQPKFFDKKINWSEKEFSNGVELKYDYFDGEKRIPIKALKGNTIKVTYLVGGKGGMMIEFLDPHGFFVKTKPGGSTVSIVAETDGEYHFVIKGNKMENGYIKVDWIVE
ncbi:hypothetical protein YDYSG_68220 [Paenibacillus tyrfis]|uniref:hypothetical protein n=1 Tax=Paenibacillus TaxID=44249 RepID=UPI000248D354|nr:MULTISPECIES: hypothetical protein [Paenibacillus]GLI10786.1 hypothetical protein YDYSG_68220 [Paenibacillus tyrfis]